MATFAFVNVIKRGIVTKLAVLGSTRSKELSQGRYSYRGRRTFRAYTGAPNLKPVERELRSLCHFHHKWVHEGGLSHRATR